MNDIDQATDDKLNDYLSAILYSCKQSDHRISYLINFKKYNKFDWQDNAWHKAVANKDMGSIDRINNIDSINSINSIDNIDRINDLNKFKCAPISFVANHEDTKILDLLLEHKADLNIHQSHPEMLSVAHSSLLLANYPMAIHLLNIKADLGANFPPNFINSITAMDQPWYKPLVTLLINAKANIDGIPKDNNSLPYLAKLIPFIASEQHTETIRFIADHCDFSKNKIGYDKFIDKLFTLSSLIIDCNRQYILTTLIKQGYQPISSHLFLRLVNGANLNCLKQLVSVGLDVNQKYDCFDQTMIFRAYHHDTLKFLIESKADLNHRMDKCTVIMATITDSYFRSVFTTEIKYAVEKISLLLKHGAPTEGVIDYMNQKCLDYYKYSGIIKLLLEHKAKANFTENFIFYNLEPYIYRLMLENKADPNQKLHDNIVGAKNSNVLMRACHHENINLIKLLVEYKAKINGDHLYDPIYPMRKAIESKNEHIIRYLTIHGGHVEKMYRKEKSNKKIQDSFQIHVQTRLRFQAMIMARKVMHEKTITLSTNPPLSVKKTDEININHENDENHKTYNTLLTNYYYFDENVIPTLMSYL